jgi:hypothetical protein
MLTCYSGWHARENYEMKTMPYFFNGAVENCRTIPESSSAYSKVSTDKASLNRKGYFAPRAHPLIKSDPVPQAGAEDVRRIARFPTRSDRGEA